jgi:RNA polymerase sigma-32 factor
MAYADTYDSWQADRRFIKASIRVPLLTREREFELARRWRQMDDEDALHELVTAYTRLVISTASRFRNYGLPVADLIQEGSIGLMQAAARFEPEREIRFSTYASWWIRSAMQDYILRNWSIVRTGTTAAQKSLFFNFRRLRAKIDSAALGPLSLEHKESIADELRVSLRDVEMMEGRLAASDQSLNANVGENGEDEWQDFIADDRPLPEQFVLGLVDREIRSTWLGEAMDSLSDRERTIISERRLKDDVVTLEELGKELGISKERVRQIEHKALEKLRGLLSRQVDNVMDMIPDA